MVKWSTLKNAKIEETKVLAQGEEKNNLEIHILLAFSTWILEIAFILGQIMGLILDSAGSME